MSTWPREPIDPGAEVPPEDAYEQQLSVDAEPDEDDDNIIPLDHVPDFVNEADALEQATDVRMDDDEDF
jgi:hypothetical protein